MYSIVIFPNEIWHDTLITSGGGGGGDGDVKGHYYHTMNKNSWVHTKPVP